MKIKAIIVILASLFSAVVFADKAACPLANGLNVHTKKHTLTICRQGTVVKSFRVALGYRGVGKKHAGDNKTPIGLYGLASPRKSSHFKVFIPILYPTARQAAAGYTGRDVGIHGPEQSSNGLGLLSNLPGATRGCVAVGKNNQIEYVANWIKGNPGARVLII